MTRTGEAPWDKIFDFSLYKNSQMKARIRKISYVCSDCGSENTHKRIEGEEKQK